MSLIWKIMSAENWSTARRAGKVTPAGADRRDGYIHLSTDDQVLETARLHFAGRDDLVAVAFDARGFGRALKWEASRGGALFPHLYADLEAARAVRARKLLPAGEGAFKFGEDVE